MKRKYFRVVLEALIAIHLSSCGLLRDEPVQQSSNTQQAQPNSRQETLFSKVHYYRDLDSINRVTSDPTSSFYFESLLENFHSDRPELSVDEAVALLYGGLNHTGYQDPRITGLEQKIDTLKALNDLEGTERMARKCLEIFPLNIVALMELWQIYQRDTTTNDEVVIGKRLNILFKGMQQSGYGEDENRPQIALSKSSIEYYCTFYAAGAKFPIEQEWQDDQGNTIVLKTDGRLFTERFIVPKRK